MEEVGVGEGETTEYEGPKNINVRVQKCLRTFTIFSPDPSPNPRLSNYSVITGSHPDVYTVLNIESLFVAVADGDICKEVLSSVWVGAD